MTIVAPAATPTASAAPATPTPTPRPVAGPEQPFDESKLLAGPGQAFVSLDDPRVLTIQQADYLDPSELVMGLTVNGESRAYPLQMTQYHHIVNDTLGGRPVAVTY